MSGLFVFWVVGWVLMGVLQNSHLVPQILILLWVIIIRVPPTYVALGVPLSFFLLQILIIFFPKILLYFTLGNNKGTT